jgi:hypothetical protein
VTKPAPDEVDRVRPELLVVSGDLGGGCCDEFILAALLKGLVDLDLPEVLGSKGRPTLEARDPRLSLPPPEELMKKKIKKFLKKFLKKSCKFF